MNKDVLLGISDAVERLIDDAQADHLNGFPQQAQFKLREAIRLLDRLAYPSSRLSSKEDT